MTSGLKIEGCPRGVFLYSIACCVSGHNQNFGTLGWQVHLHIVLQIGTEQIVVTQERNL